MISAKCRDGKWETSPSIYSIVQALQTLPRLSTACQTNKARRRSPSSAPPLAVADSRMSLASRRCAALRAACRQMGDLQDSAHRLDLMRVAVVVNEGPQGFSRRSNFAWAKNQQWIQRPPTATDIRHGAPAPFEPHVRGFPGKTCFMAQSSQRFEPPQKPDEFSSQLLFFI